MTRISRRSFLLQSSAVLAGGVTAAHAVAAHPACGAADFLYYDDRFAEAARLVRKLAVDLEPTAVQADITAVWNAGLCAASQISPLTLRGVTTDSFHFCLKVMLEERVGLESHVDRIDRDLRLWLIRTSGPKHGDFRYG